MKNFSNELIVNSFRFIAGYTEAPSNLEKVDTILGYDVYHSKFNSLVYVIYCNYDLCYYSFETSNIVDIDFSRDLYWVILIFFKRNIF